MSDTNRVRLALLEEATFGVLPGSPRFRTMRMTGESLKYSPLFKLSDEIRADRMNADPIKINEKNDGGLNFELSYPVDNGPLAALYASTFYNPWVKTPSRDNDGTADSVITDVSAAAGVITVTTGAAFVIGHLVRNSGFTNAANNGLFRATTGSATVPAFASQGLVNETAPPSTARMKVAGCQGAASDITATASGFAATTLDFTTLGLIVGQWIKPSSNAAGGFGFATTANNDWVRIIAIAANALTCDNLPSGWSVDAGTAKTIRLFFGDTLKNGTSKRGLAVERGFLDQTTPSYILQKGFIPNGLTMAWTTEQIITGSFDMMGLTGSQGTVANGASYDAASTSRVMSANVSVGRIAEAGLPVGAPNWVRDLRIDAKNNLRQLTAVGSVGAADIGAGAFPITVGFDTYYGSNAYLTKLMASTVTNLNARAQIDSQAFVMTLPRLTFSDGAPNASQGNADVILPLQAMASIDSLTQCHLQFDRVEYYD